MKKHNYKFDSNANYKVTLTKTNTSSTKTYEFECKNADFEEILCHIGRDYIVHMALQNGKYYAVNLINYDSVSIEKID